MSIIASEKSALSMLVFLCMQCLFPVAYWRVCLLLLLFFFNFGISECILCAHAFICVAYHIYGVLLYKTGSFPQLWKFPVIFTPDIPSFSLFSLWCSNYSRNKCSVSFIRFSAFAPHNPLSLPVFWFVLDSYLQAHSSYTGLLFNPSNGLSVSSHII